MEDVDLSGQNKLFIRTCVHIIKYYGLKVKSFIGKINSFFILGDTIKIKVSENSLPLSLNHDFRKYFSDIDQSPPERSV